MIRPLIALVLAAAAFSASAQPLPGPPQPSNNLQVEEAYAQAMEAIQTLQSVAQSQGPDAERAQSSLQQIASAASR